MRTLIESSRLTPAHGRSWNEFKIADDMREMREREPHRSFTELAHHYTAGVDYEIETRRGSENLLCAAWHGGFMEPGSDLLADAIAGCRYHYYAFKALFPVSDGEHPLHVTSSRFREPELITLAKESERVFAVHCCSTAPGIPRVFIGGGADQSVRKQLINALRQGGFNAGPDKIFPGSHFMNPCNAGRQPGVQIEVSQSYMDHLVAHRSELFRMAAVIADFMGSLRE